jgi:hypothetical protein
LLGGRATRASGFNNCQISIDAIFMVQMLSYGTSNAFLDYADNIFVPHASDQQQIYDKLSGFGLLCI